MYKTLKEACTLIFLIAFTLNSIYGLETFLRLRKVSVRISSTHLTCAQTYRNITKTYTLKWDKFYSKPKAEKL